MAETISRERAERIARAHACVTCGEYSFKRVSVRPASAGHRTELGEAWHVVKVCGVCATHQEMGLDEDGDVVYEG